MTLLKWLISTVAILILAYILPGVEVTGFLVALIAAILLGLVNALFRPFLVLLTLPINILTLGLFTLVINGLLVMLISAVVPGFTVGNFGWAVLFSVLLSLLTFFLGKTVHAR